MEHLSPSHLANVGTSFMMHRRPTPRKLYCILLLILIYSALLSFISLLLNAPTAIKLLPVSGVQIVTEMYEDVSQSIREGQEKNYTYFLLR